MHLKLHFLFFPFQIFENKFGWKKSNCLFNYDEICTLDCEELGEGLAAQAAENDPGLGSKKANKATTSCKQDKVHGGKI